ncbi:protocadherin-like wing polarity protein stan isoform X1 [Vespa crabro]|uniref:protocadherin-like wing polarity protein stan isoform X1 n=1 Tax=Vespa crabro TaxID=7445 RepID=UPI001F00F931|nr:protocadherin-like wing polarity protein stan isoform X1 [Vespa crabro]XP_046828166.1 protocadherin-like wing polarity protein stan isoform X1 [Vespa crabro]XP_046828168.1 protocadherin-like wing polarity protein stan isoform X1 [Vespa crabro]XP_046828169.1 protocadherin-like wing polarity protein stan isoform X1 [Vespa crabro]
MASWKWILPMCLAALWTLAEGYLAVLSSSTPVGTIVFEAGVPQLGGRRKYEVSNERTAWFARKLLKVHPHTGRVTLAKPLSCEGLQYPRIFTFYVDSTSSRLGRPTIDYYSLPLRILITGCGEENRDLAATRGWMAETLASYAMPTTERFIEVCLRTSQLVAALRDFLPQTALKECETRWGGVADPRFLIEGAAGDLVSASEQCLVDPLWKISVSMNLRCDAESRLADAEHRLKIVFHHRQLDDTDLGRRVRRELKNQSPYFEQPLYVAAIEEEKEPGVYVTSVRARDPEGGTVRYSMSSILDARSQTLLILDPVTGRVSTRARLDRESVDVHYFRVLAVDDSFPPRTGTTTLQVNVLDANDHAPCFEWPEYDASVREGVPVGSTVVTVKATDQDTGRNADVEYSIVSTSGGGMTVHAEDTSTFRIDPRSGVVTTRMPLDREKTEIYTVILCVSDLATPPSTRKTANATLIVRVLDDNDNYPQFTERTFSVAIPEDLDYTSNPIVARIRATDADAGNNAAVRYAIIGGNTQNTFSIDNMSGDVALVKPLDYESMRSYKIVIRAQDGGTPPRSNTTQLLVHVKDVNDNAPRFYTSHFQDAVAENVPIGYSVLKVQAYDADEGVNAQIKYTIASRDFSGASTDNFPITVNPDTGWIYTTKQLDREECSRYQFTVIASDSGEESKSASVTVILTVSDVNDNDPYFDPKNYDAVVSEDDPPGTPVTSVTATDPDEDAKIHYEITAGNTRGRFSIASQNGRGLITVAQPLDYKQEKRFVLTVTASDSGGRTDTALVYVNVSDANNFSPVFENAPYSVSVFEDAPVGTTVLVVSATDSDVGKNAQVTYSLGTDGDEQEAAEFTINSQTGAITTTRALDREKVPGYVLTVTARDGGVPPLSDTTDIEISVTDVNDNAPMFEAPQYQGSIPEDVLVGTSVLRVSATDEDIDLNGRVRYALEDDGDGAFAIDPTTGIVRTSKSLDRESVARYILKAVAADRGSPSLSSVVPVIVKIEDVNDSPPAFENDKIVLYIAENSPVGSTVGEIYAHDPDEGPNAVVQYSVIGGEDSNSFALNVRPGGDRAELVTLEELDYESPKKKFELVVRAASPPLRSDALVQIMVTDVNDNAPVLKDFQIIFNNFKDFFPTTAIGKIPAVDADVTDKLVYSILAGNNANLIDLNKTTGEIRLSPQLNTNVPRVATMEVSVTDGVNEAKATMTLSVRLITDEMLLNSITVRLDDMTVEAFLSPLLGYFLDGLAAIIPCPRENIFLFSIQEDANVQGKILNVSFSARKVEPGTADEFYSPQFLQERVYLNRGILARLATVTVLPFDDNLCVREPCLNFEECLTVLKFGNASGFASSDTVLFRPIYPVTTFACKCAKGFTGSREAYLCDTEVNLCYSNPCQNGGTCHRREGGYACSCSPDYTGENCQISLDKNTCAPDICKGGSQCTIKNTGGFTCEGCPVRVLENVTPLCELKARSFGPATFLTFASLKQRHRLHLRLRFATESSDGLLLYNGRYNEKHDFVALEIIESHVQFSFSLGDEVTRASAEIPGGVSDGQWHEVEVSYINKTVTISLDNCDVALALEHGERLGPKWACAGRSEQILEDRCGLITETCHRFLDLTGPLQLGGLPAIPSNFPVRTKDFVGCISDLYIDHIFVDLNSFVADNGTNAGCPEKNAFCSSIPCKNNGECREVWDGFICECTENFAGPTCEDEVGKPWKFHGDGLLNFNPLLRPIQLPWLTALSLRTRAKHAFVMAVQIGQNSSVLLEIRDGKMVASLDGTDIIRTWYNIADGEWHRLEVLWQSGHVSLDMDYRDKPLNSPLAAKLQGLYVGRILVGGPDQSINTELPFYDGCLQDLRIGTNQSVLQRPTVQENVETGCISESVCSIDCPEASICVTKWQASECVCAAGRVGRSCELVCDLNPCNNTGTCVEEKEFHKGYRCDCNSPEYSGDYCEIKADQPCPATWWGTPVCGPCHCDESKGYDPACNKTTGECYCKENHYQPPGQKECIPCGCYAIGSFGPRCDTETGQCRCRVGVIGRSCTACPNPYAEVTLQGCEVIYDGCPRSYSEGLWWPRTKFGMTAVEDCPDTAEGKTSRSCDDKLGGWQPPDLFNCTSEAFVEQRHQLAALEAQDLMLNTYVAVKLAKDVHDAANVTKNMYGADLLVAESLLIALLRYEESLIGLNLTHSQDKDYVANLAGIASAILQTKYLENWRRIESLNGDSPDKILNALARYLNTLTASQHDTFTSPFEVVDRNIVLGLDIVTSESLFGFEAAEYKEDPSMSTARPSEADRKVVLPDTSAFLSTTTHFGPSISFPKYNNYMADPKRFDTHSKIQVPLSILGIKPLAQGELNVRNSLSNRKAVLSYVQYKELGSLLPQRFDDSVAVRWGVEVSVGSPVMTVSVLVPSKNGYESMTGIPLQSPVQVRLWLSENDDFKTRTNPQCVHWNTAKGTGEWSRMGCTTEIEDNSLSYGSIVNCSCLQLSTFAVLTDVLDLEYVPEPSLLEDVTSYSAFMLALPLLLSALLILALIRGTGTNSNSIHKNLVLCVFLGETLYLIALKARSPLVTNEFPCKLTAIGLHYAWLSTFAWTLVDSIHLYRMLTEMRDVNHGQMRFYYTMGYGMPAVIVGLTIGVRADQYGNFYFCWLSIYETVIWSLIGPVCVAIFVNFCILVMSIRAAFTLKEHIMGFGNLRTLLWLSVASLPLLGSTWTLAVLNASETSPTLSYLLSVAIVVHAAFSLIGYCFINGRVRRNLYLSLLRCVGKKAPLLEGSMANGSSSQNVNGHSRSALAYSSTYSGAESVCRRVHVGVSTSSTTSRSTNKTGSSPYRSDTHLRHTSTSTSNYNSDRDPYMSSRSQRSVVHPRQESNESRNPRRDSESDSDGSQAEGGGRSLDLASSHSSDEDDVTSRSHRNMGVSAQQPVAHSYLPNIHSNPAEHLNILCSNAELFPNIKPIYAPRWSSQLPEAYLSSNVMDVRGSQWSGGTMSDNEMASNKTSSPNPLPYPEMNSPQKSQLDENYSEGEEKIHHVGEKYLFPYTAEEDHTISPTPYMLSMSTRILASSMSHHSQNSNHENMSGSERYGSLKRGQSLHGSQHDNMSGSERYGSLKRGKITPTVLEDAPEFILPMSGRILSSSLTHDLQHSNELAALRQQQQQQQYEQTITETEKDTNAETSV